MSRRSCGTFRSNGEFFRYWINRISRKLLSRRKREKTRYVFIRPVRSSFHLRVRARARARDIARKYRSSINLTSWRPVSPGRPPDDRWGRLILHRSRPDRLCRIINGLSQRDYQHFSTTICIVYLRSTCEPKIIIGLPFRPSVSATHRV